MDEMQAKINILLKNYLKSHPISWLEESSLKLSVYSSFQNNHKLEEAYYQLLEIFSDESLESLIPKLKEIYNSFN